MLRKINYVATLGAFFVSLTAFAQEQVQSGRIAVGDLPRLIIDLKFRRMPNPPMYLGPENYRQFYRFMDSRSHMLYPKADSSFTDPILIGPEGHNKSFWLSTPDSGALISVLHQHEQFERIENFFVIWQSSGDSLQYKCISDTTLETSIGYAYLEEIHALDKGYLLIGGTGGGDAGDAWGSIWFGIWDGDCFVNRFFESRYNTRHCQYSEDMTYTFDPASMKAVITRQRRLALSCMDDIPVYSEPLIITTESVDLAGLISARSKK